MNLSIIIIIIGLIVVCLVIYHFNSDKIKNFLLENFYKQRLYSLNKDFFNIVERLPIRHMSKNNIPECFNCRLNIVNVPDLKNIETNKEKVKKVMDVLCEKTEWEDYCRDDIVVFDLLVSVGAYFPSAHTDTEWNKISNDGYQVWCLESNTNPEKKGNMFLFYNESLTKYNDIGYFLRKRGDDIWVVKNCKWSENIWGTINKENLLEKIPIDTFVKETTKYYLDFEDGDCIAFAKNILHMSDYRDKTKSRKAINFRVAIKNAKKELKLKEEVCGYLNSVSETLQDPGKYSIISN